MLQDFEYFCFDSKQNQFPFWFILSVKMNDIFKVVIEGDIFSLPNR